MRILNIVGARPNFMKIAPLMAAMRRHPGFEPMLVHTGQHYDENLSRVFFEQLRIPRPDVNLGVGSGTRDEQIESIRVAFRPLMDAQRPDAVLVVGDVNSTIACAGVARERGVAVVHVEAGLRSFDPTMPEELNRRETDEISDFLFVTEESGMSNLEREKVPGMRFLVGNVMIDTLVANLERIRESDSPRTLGVEDGGYMVATFHRPSNVDERDRLERLLALLTSVCARVPVVLPLHPRTRHSLEAHALLARMADIENLLLCDPLGYLDFMRLVLGSKGVITDSGGLQEETTYLRIPCLTMRANTERPVTMDVGSNLLIGDDHERLVLEVDNILAGRFKSGDIPALWDGHAAERIVTILADVLGGTGKAAAV